MGPYHMRPDGTSCLHPICEANVAHLWSEQGITHTHTLSLSLSLPCFLFLSRSPSYLSFPRYVRHWSMPVSAISCAVCAKTPRAHASNALTRTAPSVSIRFVRGMRATT